jgi:hypothetical protein
MIELQYVLRSLVEARRVLVNAASGDFPRDVIRNPSEAYTDAVLVIDRVIADVTKNAGSTNE